MDNISGFVCGLQCALNFVWSLCSYESNILVDVLHLGKNIVTRNPLRSARMATVEDTGLPAYLTKVLPDDPYEQLDLARKITSLALATRVYALEARMGQLRQTLDIKDSTIADLQQRIAEADQTIQKTSIKILKTTDDQIRLSKENEKLHESIFKLKNDVSKMETFRKLLVHTLRMDKTISEAIEEENTTAPPPLSPRTSTTRALVPYSDSPPPPPRQIPLRPVDYLQAEDDLYLSRPQYAADDDRRRMLLFKSRQSRKSMSDVNTIPLYNPPDAAPRPGPAFGLPTQAPPPKKEASPERPPRRISVAISPERSPPRTRSAQGSPRRKSIQAPASPLIQFPALPSHATPPRSPNIQMSNGKEFFRQAKNRLSYDQFRALLTTIKDLNSHKLAREEALGKAEEIFGEANQDLYVFLAQHLPS